MSTTIRVRDANPALTIVPGDDHAGICPTLLVDDVPWHDPSQPYREVLHLEGTSPEVVVLFGVGLGYGAAGVAQLAPAARIIAFEPLPGMAELARLVLDQEWNLGARVVVESDLADFQARLLEALFPAASLAVVELQALAAREPGLAARFRDTLRETIAATTFGALPANTDGERWAQIARHAHHLAVLPRFASLAGTLAGTAAALVAEPPSAEAALAIRKIAEGGVILSGTEALPSLLSAGIQPDLALIHDQKPPAPEVVSRLGNCWLAVTPDSHPGWLEAPSRGICLFGHTATAWMFPAHDMAHLVSFRWGQTFPLAAAGAALGVQTAYLVSPLPGADQGWNLLEGQSRQFLTGRLCLMGNGGELLTCPSPDQVAARAPLSRDPIFRRWKQAARPLGASTLRQGLTRARSAVSRLGRECHAFPASFPPGDLFSFLRHRAEGDPFTRAFVKPLLDIEPENVQTIAHRLEGTQGYLDWVEQNLPAAAPGTATAQAGDTSADHLAHPIFIGGGPADFVPQRVLLAALDDLAATRLEVRYLHQEVQARFAGRAAALPETLWPLLIPELCQQRGKALFIDPAVVPLEDPRALFGLLCATRPALAPALGPPRLAVIDCARAPWSVEQVLADPAGADACLKPGGAGRTGALPDPWFCRDAVRLDSAAVHFTCTPWLPWHQDLHPLRWLWECQFLRAVFAGYIAFPELEREADRGRLRRSLVERALLPGGAANPEKGPLDLGRLSTRPSA